MVDLTPFGFTGTESRVYDALLRLGTATGYAAARATRLARANVYAALEGLVHRGAAARLPGHPTQYRPTDPQTLLVQLGVQQAAALDRLERSLRTLGGHDAATIHVVEGGRGVGHALQQLMARAERSVAGIVGAEFWRAVLPALRRAADHARFDLRAAGATLDDSGLLTGEPLPADTPTLVVIDEAVCAIAAGEGEGAAAVWSTHPLLVEMARRALRSV